MKKTSIKKIVSKAVIMLMVAVMTVGIFSGCGKKANDKNEQGQTILTVGNWPDKEGLELDNINLRKKRFEEANKDVALIPDLWNFDRKTFYAKAAGGQLPILFGAGYTEVREIIDSEYSADITAAMKAHGYDKKLNPLVADVISRDGKFYAFPSGAAILGLACNMDLMEKAGLVEADGTPFQPKDWNETLQFAIKIKEATGKPGLVFPTGNRSGGWIFSQLAWSFGTEFMKKDEDGNWKATFNTPECTEALQFIKDLKWKYKVISDNALIDGTQWWEMLATGNAGITMATGDFVASVQKFGMKPEQIGMMAMPSGPKKHVTLITGSIFCLNNKATDDQIDAGLRWIETECNYDTTDEFKRTKEEQIKGYAESGRHVGIKKFSIWNDASGSLAYENELIKKYSNANPNHVKLYNEFVENCPIEIRAEEPVSPQELYIILDSCLQEVLSNEDADCAKILEKANANFQSDYLDDANM